MIRKGDYNFTSFKLRMYWLCVSGVDDRSVSVVDFMVLQAT